MKKLSIFLVLVFVVTFNSFSQNAEQEIRKVVIEYLNYGATNNFSKAAEYLPDGYFDVFSKEKYLKTLEERINNSNIEVKVSDFKIIEVSKIEKINEKYYSIVTFSFLMKIKVNIEEIAKELGVKIDEEIYDMLVERMVFEVEKELKKENVKYNKETDLFVVVKKNVVVSKNGITDWKFIDIDESGEKTLLKKFVPKEILKQL